MIDVSAVEHADHIKVYALGGYAGEAELIMRCEACDEEICLPDAADSSFTLEELDKVATAHITGVSVA